ncbi:hypothetical protein [Bradyrhizobium elkanii]|uniref:hypothetical protein n=1 Tax=Bradyrhizobium elkanii TaxID=29448 RepID=UPI002226B044|nr:hypothetical protein [Bradyrhizobium elkanii]MCW2130163.1 hypothetical protein [Bradyrhizobium elkanii]MCW2167840.1 hypothetical protein [Bradyrhizobium elkanii]
MGLAVKLSFDDPSVSAEAKKRLDSARAHDIAFVVKQRLGRADPQDVEMIVEMILAAEQHRHPLTPDHMRAYLRERNRSPHKVEQLTTLLFKAAS